jgi:hypothetical protein
MNASVYGDLARPERLPKPKCRVMLICGPPAAGKSTYVREHMSAGDSLIDFDTIAKEHGYGRERPANSVGEILMDRNERLAALSKAPRDHVAWVIITAASDRMRRWWVDTLNVAANDLILLVPSREELFRRIRSDPERKSVRVLHETLIRQWFARERDDKPSHIQRGCDNRGWPLDPLHDWNIT